MSQLAVLEGAIARLEELVADLEPDVLESGHAARLVESFARGERLCAAGKALAARRVEACGTWRTEGFRSSAHWLAERSGSTVGDAEGALRVARMVDDLPATDGALRSGDLSLVQAREIAEAAAFDPRAEDALLVAASESSVKVLRDECHRVRAASVDDDAAWAACQQAARRLDRWTDPDGTGRGDWKLAPADAALVNAAIDAEADRIFREARRWGRREAPAAYAADALVRLLTRGPSKAPEVKVTTDLAPIERGCVAPSERCEIDGFGPIPVTVARALLQDARVSVLVADDTGDIRTVTSPKPTIPRRLRRRLEHRDPRCANHRCRGPGPYEIDHIVPRAEGGQTELDNLWRLCRHCHRLKTYFGWRVALDARSRLVLEPADRFPEKGERHEGVGGDGAGSGRRSRRRLPDDRR